MFYDRKVRYIDYKKNGERIHGAGFIKIEVRDKVCNIQIKVSNMHVTDSFQKQIYALFGNREEPLCMLELQEGRGDICLKLEKDNLCNGLHYEELDAIRIPIGAGRELYCEIEKTEMIIAAEVKTEEKVEIEKQPEEESVLIEQTEETEIDILEDALKEDILEENVLIENVLEETEPEKNIKSNKWEQLWDIYPHINPFQDEREYLRMGPEDFVILDEKSYQGIHNSFLLHGYYNYGHLILTRQKQQGNIHYYIGVPGNYFDREKQVAIMFGFESFECKEEPSAIGEFGYYMLPVSL